MVRDSIYMVSSGSTEPYDVPGASERQIDEAQMDDAQMDEAEKSLVEDAMRDHYEQKPGPEDHVLKP